MRIVLLADADDVRGFALAGLDGRVCEDQRAAETALAQIEAHATEVGLVIVSAAVASVASCAIEGLHRQDGGPAVVILPGAETSAADAERSTR